ncbi:hypothetical protein [Microbacterium sp. NPDC077184]
MPEHPGLLNKRQRITPVIRLSDLDTTASPSLDLIRRRINAAAQH